jgi:xanthine dehydrogenase large subunit
MNAAGGGAPPILGGVGAALRHDSAHLHVAGAAPYVDDILEARGTLHAAFGLSERAHARIVSVDLAAVRAAPGVVAVLLAADIPGENNFGPILHDDPILAGDKVQYFGQPVFVVAAHTVEAARRAARLARIVYEDLPALLTIDDALAAQSFVIPSVRLARGDAAAALAAAPRRVQGEFRFGGQEQFYLEGQIAYAIPIEDGTLRVHNSTQHPGEVQLKVAEALGLPAASVTVECRRMGGGFGGKETQPALFACAAALLARHTGRPVKLRADRDDDIMITGKRHDFLVRYDAGFDASGRLLGLELMLASRCGYSADLSGPVNDRAMTHADNCYFLENVAITSHRLKTHTQSATAFRGFGGPQGMMAIEYVLDEVARDLAIDPLEVRRRNFYVEGGRDTTHYGMRVEDNIIHELVAELAGEAKYAERRAALAAWNAASPVIKRGIALTPVKFGISFTATHMNQAGALLQLYTDGTVLLNHGGTEMGQGLFTKVAQVVAEELQIDVAKVRVSASDTSKVPNASATAASSGGDLNGKAAQAAARTLKQRLSAFAATHFKVAPAAVRFAGNRVNIGEKEITFAELARLAWFGRVSLSATGFYQTPKISYNPKTLMGRPFYYFSYGAALAEVAIDTLTGETRLLRADILQDAGRSLNPAIDIGQVEGGFVQGMGWLTSEELWWDDKGRLRTHAPSTYKIPVAGDVPEAFNVRLYERGENVEDSIFRSKAVGEPPLMLAISVFHAIKDAVAAAAGYRVSPRLDAPATPERVLFAVAAARAAGSDTKVAKQ